jgi:DNA-binding NarL/FixJ family response regulator
VNLPTIVVCDGETGKCEQIDTMINGQPDLVLLGTIDRDAAKDNLPDSVKVAWIELAPDPQKGLQLLGELKLAHPGMNFLVSYDTLQSDLVKSALQIGAIEYLDAQSGAKLLNEAVKRILSKEANARPVASAVRSGPPPVMPAPSEKAASTVRESKNMRSKVSQLDGSPTGLPTWILPSIVLILLIVVVGVYFTQSH